MPGWVGNVGHVAMGCSMHIEMPQIK